MPGGFFNDNTSSVHSLFAYNLKRYDTLRISNKSTFSAINCSQFAFIHNTKDLTDYIQDCNIRSVMSNHHVTNKKLASLLPLAAAAQSASAIVVVTYGPLTVDADPNQALMWDIDGSNSTNTTFVVGPAGAGDALALHPDANAGVFFLGNNTIYLEGAQRNGMETQLQASFHTANFDTLLFLASGYVLGPGNFDPGDSQGRGMQHFGNMTDETPLNFGFRFSTDGGTNVHYGWGTLLKSAANDTLTITRWGYETTPNTPIVVPEPSQLALGLGALAMGAAGLRRWRKAKQAA